MFKYLAGYPEPVLAQVRQLSTQNRLGDLLLKKYATTHGVRTDRALFDYVQALKTEYLSRAAPLSKVMFDNTLHVIEQALGTHTTVSRVQGNKLRAKREIRIAALFKKVPIEFLRVITVHELAHLRENAHGKAFYQLCTHMEPHYHQYEFDLRLYLTHRETAGDLRWPGNESIQMACQLE